MHIPEMTVTELYKNDRENLVLIDVREPDEFQAGHIAGSTLIPLGDLATKMSEISQSETVVLICRSGNRSSMALSWLQQHGYTQLYNLRGGMLDWAKQGYPVEREV